MFEREREIQNAQNAEPADAPNERPAWSVEALWILWTTVDYRGLASGAHR